MQRKLHHYISELNTATSRSHVLLLIFIIVTGFLLRFYAYFVGHGYHFFSINDEVSAFRVALSFLAGEERAYYLGQPNFSDGHAPGPGWTLYWVAALKLGGDSVDRALFVVALLNSVLIYFVYYLARQFLQPMYALLAVFLFAVSPWPVYYAVGLWNPIPMAFWGCLLFISLWQVTQKQDSRSIFWVCLLSAVIPHFHMIGIFYLPAILLIIYLSPVRINKKYFAVGILAGFMVYLPYLIGEYQHNWENTRLVLGAGKDFSVSVLKIISAPVTVLSNHPGRWPGDEMNEFMEFGNRWFGSYILLLLINLVSMIIAASYIGWLIKRFVTNLNLFQLRKTYQHQPRSSFLVIILVLPLLLFVVTGQNYSSRYTIIILPLLFLLPAYFLQEAKHTRLKKIIIVTMPFMVVFNFYLLGVFYYHQNNEIHNDQFLVTTFKKLESIRGDIKQHAGPDVYIKIDASEYIKNTTDKIENAGIALTEYVEGYERHITHGTKPDKVVVYKIIPQKGAAVDESSIAYRGNGVVIAAVETQTN